MSETPQEPAKVVPGRGGVVAPTDRRFGQPNGNPGNPGGRPKGASILGPLLRKLAARPNEHGEGAEAERKAQALLDAIDGADGKLVDSILKLIDRTDGPVRKELELSGTMPVQVNIRGVDTKTSREDGDVIDVSEVKALGEAQRALPGEGDGQGERARSAQREEEKRPDSV